MTCSASMFCFLTQMVLQAVYSISGEIPAQQDSLL